MALPKKIKLTPEQQAFADYAYLGMLAGCPVDQMRNFFNAGVILQPKQLEIVSACRACDQPNGPKDIMAGGGRGAAKTHAILAQIFCDDCQRMPGLKVLVLRKVGRANKEQISDFRKKLLSKIPHKYREQASTITFENESLVILGNFKDERDIDKYLGLEYDVIHIVESNQLTLTKKKNIISCLRTNKQNWRTRCYEDTNPGGIGHFHNKQIFVEPWKAKQQTETRYIHCTVDDNRFVDADYKKILESYTGWQREAWLHGSWDFMAGAFFTNFVPEIHVYPNEKITFLRKSAVRWMAAYDFGFAHNTAFLLAAQNEQGDIFVECEYLEHENTIEEVAMDMKAMLREFMLEPEDLSYLVAGRDCFNRNEEGKTIAVTFQDYGIILSPAEVDRLNGWARMMDGFGDIRQNIRPRLYINRRCVNLITQIQMAQHCEKRPGDIEKFNANEEGEGGDDLLDACFVGGTMIKTEIGEMPISEIRPGMKVWTRQGIKLVSASAMTNPAAEVFSVEFSDGRKITATKNHPILTENGWKSIDSLRNGDIVFSWPKQSYSTESNSDGIQNQSGRICETITGRGATIASGALARCIRKFGEALTGAIQALIKFTTRIKIRSTTTFQTLNALPILSTSRNTQCPETPRWLLISTEYATSPPLGIKPRNVPSLQKGIGRHLLVNALSSVITFVNFVAGRSNPNRSMLPRLNFAPANARLHSSGKMGDMRGMPCASSAGKVSKRASSITPELVRLHVRGISPAGRSAVYNLTVQECPEYFANGILAHNCRFLVSSDPETSINCATPLQMGSYKAANVKQLAAHNSLDPMGDEMREAEAQLIDSRED